MYLFFIILLAMIILYPQTLIVLAILMLIGWAVNAATDSK